MIIVGMLEIQKSTKNMKLILNPVILLIYIFNIYIMYIYIVFSRQIIDEWIEFF